MVLETESERDDGTLLALKMEEGAMTQGMQRIQMHLNTEKGKEIDSSLESLEELRPCGNLEFSLLDLVCISNFQQHKRIYIFKPLSL